MFTTTAVAEYRYEPEAGHVIWVDLPELKRVLGLVASTTQSNLDQTAIAARQSYVLHNVVAGIFYYMGIPGAHMAIPTPDDEYILAPDGTRTPRFPPLDWTKITPFVLRYKSTKKI